MICSSAAARRREADRRARNACVVDDRVDLRRVVRSRLPNPLLSHLPRDLSLVSGRDHDRGADGPRFGRWRRCRTRPARRVSGEVCRSCCRSCVWPPGTACRPISARRPRAPCGRWRSARAPASAPRRSRCDRRRSTWRGKSRLIRPRPGNREHGRRRRMAVSWSSRKRRAICRSSVAPPDRRLPLRHGQRNSAVDRRIGGGVVDLLGRNALHRQPRLDRADQLIARDQRRIGQSTPSPSTVIDSASRTKSSSLQPNAVRMIATDLTENWATDCPVRRVRDRDRLLACLHAVGVLGVDRVAAGHHVDREPRARRGRGIVAWPTAGSRRAVVTGTGIRDVGILHRELSRRIGRVVRHRRWRRLRRRWFRHVVWGA